MAPKLAHPDAPVVNVTGDRAFGVVPTLQRRWRRDCPPCLDCRTRCVPHPAMPAFARMDKHGFEALMRAAAQ